MGVLQGVALDYAEGRGYNTPSDLDAKGWSLLHNAASESQHRRGMFAVVRGLLEVMPTKLVNQKTGGGLPDEWAALSLISNARDPFNERAKIARLLAEKRADVNVRTPLRRHAPDGRVCLRQLVVRAGPPGRGRRPPRHQQPWPQRLGRHARGPMEGIKGHERGTSLLSRGIAL